MVPLEVAKDKDTNRAVVVDKGHCLQPTCSTLNGVRQLLGELSRRRKRNATLKKLTRNHNVEGLPMSIVMLLEPLERTLKIMYLWTRRHKILEGHRLMIIRRVMTVEAFDIVCVHHWNGETPPAILLRQVYTVQVMCPSQIVFQNRFNPPFIWWNPTSIRILRLEVQLQSL